MNLDEMLRSISGTPRYAKHTIRKGHRVSDRRKKKRIIYVPNDALRELHELFVRALRKIVSHSHHVTGGLPGCSPRWNVWHHRRNRYFYLIDLKDAYRHVDLETLARALVARDPEISLRSAIDFLRDYCMAEEGGLATGLPASPDLFNLYAAALLDTRLSSFLGRHKITYTRYLDDLTFSSTTPLGVKKRSVIRGVVLKAGFQISHHKSAVHDLRKGSIAINGVGLEWGGRLFLPRKALRHLRGVTFETLRGNIEPSILHGLMGDFWGVTALPLNKTEVRAVLAYERVRGRLRQAQALEGA